MYWSLPLKKQAHHKKRHPLHLEPKKEWNTGTDNYFMPYLGVLTSIENATRQSIFHFYYTLDRSFLRFERVRFSSSSTLYSQPNYKDLLYEQLFDAFITHRNNIAIATKRPPMAIIISTDDIFAITQMLERKFYIHKITDSDLYKGMLLK